MPFLQNSGFFQGFDTLHREKVKKCRKTIEFVDC